MAGNTDKKLVEDIGIGYKSSYKDKKTGEDVGYLKLYIRPALFNALEVNERGVVELTAFSLTGPKKSEKSPDIVIKPTLKRKASAHVVIDGATTSEVAKTSDPFPFG